MANDKKLNFNSTIKFKNFLYFIKIKYGRISI